MCRLWLLMAFFLCALHAKDRGELADFTNLFSIRSVENGLFLSVNRSSKNLIAQNWRLREIILGEKLRKRDPYKDLLPFGTVQFVDPTHGDRCLAIDQSGFFVGKSCKRDLEQEKLETVFSIMPTSSGAVQIRSLILNGNKCISTFENPNVPAENRFGILRCGFEINQRIHPSRLFIFTPPLMDARVVG